MACLAAQALLSIALLPAIFSAAPTVWPIYAIVFVIGVARSFSQPSLAALLPNVVPAGDFARAVSISASSLQFALMVGPALGGLLLAFNGPSLFWAAAALNGLAAVLMARVKATPQAEGGAAPPMAGCSPGFPICAPIGLVLGAISLDLFAVLFGGATALLPIFARDILHLGPCGPRLSAQRARPSARCAWAFVLARRPIQRGASAR